MPYRRTHLSFLCIPLPLFTCRPALPLCLGVILISIFLAALAKWGTGASSTAIQALAAIHRIEREVQTSVNGAKGHRYCEGTNGINSTALTAGVGDLSGSSPRLAGEISTGFTMNSGAADTITLSPVITSIVLGTSVQFAAAANRRSNPRIIWSVSGTGCSGASCGTVSSAGLYVAPVDEPASATVTISATSASDQTKAASVTVAIVPPQAAGYTLAWEDTFSALKLCSGTSSANCSWFNGTVGADYGTVTAPSGTYVNLNWEGSQVYPTTIATASPNGHYYNAWAFGYFEVSMAFDPVPGSWPALWMQPVQSIGTKPFSGGEIDLLEWQSSAKGQPGVATAVNGTIHVWRNGVEIAGTGASAARQVPRGTNFANYNTYGLLWTPTAISWYLNNALMGTSSIEESPYKEAFGGQQKYFLILSQLAGCNWKPSYTTPCPGQVSPINMRVRWVHAFEQRSKLSPANAEPR
jgi:hypothetical protein